MPRKFSRSHLHMSAALLAFVFVLLLAGLVLRLFGTLEPHPALAAWERVRQAGSYHFAADITQITTPLATVTNVGRTSTRNAFAMQGATDLHKETMQMRLWSEGGSVLLPGDGMEMRVEDGKAYARQGGQEWEEVDSGLGAFAPGGDFLGYLVGARDLHEAGSETRTLPTGETVSFTRYTFTINGPRLAMQMRERLERQLTEQGELPPGIALDAPKSYAEMTGSGELWVGSNGLPLRQILHVQFPPEKNQVTSAEISINFSRYGQVPGGAWALGLGNWGVMVGDWAVALLPTLVALGLVVSLTVALVVLRRSRRAQVLAALGLVGIMVFEPLLLNLKLAEFGRTQTAAAAEQAQQQAQETARQAALGRLGQPTVDPHADPLAALSQDVPATSEAIQRIGLGQANELGLPVLPENDDGLDTDGDGLTDVQEGLIGTSPTLADSDGDGLPDGAEVRGFRFADRNWYSDPNEPDTNLDGIADSETVTLTGTGGQQSITNPQNADDDNIPDLFDDDNDNDGVPNTLDLSPNRSLGNRDVLNFSITNLGDGKPTLVDFQFRPAEARHLQLAGNVLDWPEDRQGTIQDGDNGTFASADPQNTDPLDSQGDMRLVPMLEIRASTEGGAATNLPLTTPRVTVDLAAVGDSNVAGRVTLAEQGGNVVVTEDLPASATRLELQQGTCENPDTQRGSRDITAGLNGTLRDRVLVDFPPSTSDRSGEPAGLHIRAENAAGGILACGNVVRPSLEGGLMIDHELLAEYGITVRDADDKSLDTNPNNGDGDKLIYVPLRVETNEQTGQRVAFAGRMFYQPRAVWQRDQQAQLVWTVSILADVCAPDGFQDGQCTRYAQTNQPQVVHTYTDPLLLTGLEVREDHGANLAVLYEDPAVDQDVADDRSLTIAATGLRSSFLRNRDFDLAELENRFDRTRNAGLPADDTLGLNSNASANILRVERHSFAYIDALLAGITVNRPGEPGVNQEVLDRVFKPLAQSNPNLIPLLLFAREERIRGLNLDAPATSNTVLISQNSIKLDLRQDQVKPSELRGLNWAPFRFNATAERWDSVDVGDYWSELDRRYPLDALPLVDSDPTNDLVERQGLRGVIRLTHLTFFLGVTGIVQVGDVVVEAPSLGADFEFVNSIATTIINFNEKVDGLLIELITTLRESAAQRSTEPPPLDELAAFSEGLQTGTSGAGLGSRLLDWARENSINLAFFAADVAILVLSTVQTFAALDGEGKFTIDAIVTTLTAITRIVKPVKDFIDVIKDAGVAIGDAVADGISGFLKSLAKPGAIFGIVVSVVLAVTSLALFLVHATQSGLAQGSIEFNLLLASTLATIIVSFILLAISFIPVFGQLITGIIALFDFLLNLIGLPGLSELLAQVIAKTLYGFELMVAMTQEITDTDLTPDPEKGMVVGSTLRLDMDIRTTFTEVQPDQDVWMIYSPFGLPFFNTLYTPDTTLCSATATYSLSAAATSLRPPRSGNRFNCRNGNIRDTDIRKPSGIGAFQAGDSRSSAFGTVPLTKAGINQNPPLYLNSAFNLPAISCWMVPIPVPVPIPPFIIVLPGAHCEKKDVTNADSSDMSSSIVLDVLPATLPDFYHLAPRADGGFGLAWDSRFPTLADADGDGLFSLARGGNDPDDRLVDSDGDGLTDAHELAVRAAGILVDPGAADFDRDGLTDPQELRFGSNPINPDTDNDSLTDKQEVDGWEVTIGVTTTLLTGATSDPTNPDTDGDGLSDLTEQLGRGQGYHPRVVNPNPVGIVTSVDDEDGYVQPGQPVVLTAQVTNRTTGFSDGTLQIAVPPALGGGTRTAAINLVPNQAVSSAFPLTIDPAAPGQRIAIDSTAQVRRIFPPDTQFQLQALTSSFGNLANPISDVMVAPDPRPGHYQVSARASLGQTSEAGLFTGKLGLQTAPVPALTGSGITLVNFVREHDVACADNGRCLVVWQGRNTRIVVGGRMVRPDGTLETPFAFATGNAIDLRPVVATNGDEFLVAWQASGASGQEAAREGMWAARVTNTGQIIGPVRIVSGFNPVTRLSDAVTPADGVFAAHENRYYVASAQVVRSVNPTAPTSIRLYRVNPTNLLLAPVQETVFSLPANTPDQVLAPQLAYSPQGGRTMLVFIQSDRLSGGNARVFATFRDPQDTAWRAPFFVGNGSTARVALDPTTQGWVVQTGATYRFLDLNGNPTSAPTGAGSLATSVRLGNGSNAAPLWGLACPAVRSLPTADIRFEEGPGATSFANSGRAGGTATCGAGGCPAAGAAGRVFNGRAVSFTGNQTVVLPVNAAGNQVVLSAWVRADRTDGTRTIFASDNAFLRINNGFYEAGSGTAAPARVAIPAADVDAWVFLAAVFDNGRWTLYNYPESERNNPTVKPGVSVTGAPQPAGAWTVGQGFVGELDDVRSFEVALDARTVRSLFGDALRNDCLLAGPTLNNVSNLGTVSFGLRPGVARIATITNQVRQTLVFDRTGPTAQFTTLTSGQHLDGRGSQVIGGTATDDASGVASVEVSIANGPFQPAEGREAWAFTLPLDTLPAGPVTLQVRGTDETGLTGDPTSLTINIDRTPPVATVNTGQPVRASRAEDDPAGWIVPLAGIVSDNASGPEQLAVLLVGQGEAEGNAAQVATIQGNTWSINYRLGDVADPSGLYNVTFEATDAVGNTAQQTSPQPVAIDNTPPIAALNADQLFTPVFSQTVTVNGVMTDTGTAATGVDRLEWSLVPAERAELLQTIRGELALELPMNGNERLTQVGTTRFCAGVTCPTVDPNGKVDQALTFDRLNNVLSVAADVPEVNYTSALWVKTTCRDCGIFSVAGRVSSDFTVTQDRDIYLQNGNVCVRTYVAPDFVGQEQPTVCTSGLNVADGQWHQLAHVIDTSRTTQFIYVDGQERARATVTRSMIDQQGNVLIGESRAASRRFLGGSLDEVMVFNRALRAEEVQALFRDASRVWNPATVARRGAGVLSSAWSFLLPADVEGFFQLDMRGTDVLGNRNDDRVAWRVWRGEIDTRSPQVSVRLVSGSPPLASTYECQAQDLNLVADSLQCGSVQPPAGVIERTPYDSAWWDAITVGQNAPIERLIEAVWQFGPVTGETPPVRACDLYGRCTQANTTRTIVGIPTPNSVDEAADTGTTDTGMHPRATAVEASPVLAQTEEPPLGSAILTPTVYALLTSTETISVTAVATAEAGLAEWTLTADGVEVGRRSYTAPNPVSDTLTVSWTPPGEGLIGLQSTLRDTTGAITTTEPLTVVVDTLPPTLTLTTRVVTSTPGLLGGTVRDAALDEVQVKVGDSFFIDASVDGDEWQAGVLLRGEVPDGEPLAVQVRAVDQAGRTTELTETVVADFTAPRAVSVTLGYRNTAGAVVALAEGDRVPVAPATLVLTWNASSDGSGIREYWAGWTDSPEPVLGDLTRLATDAERRVVQQAGEATVRYAHLVSYDGQGNAQVQTVGPVYVDSAATPDLLNAPEVTTPTILREYTNWLDSGCTWTGTNDELATRQPAQGVQRFYTTWDAQTMRLAWQGANWERDGDLFIYFDTDPANPQNGATRAFNPFGQAVHEVFLPSVRQGAVTGEVQLAASETAVAAPTTETPATDQVLRRARGYSLSIGPDGNPAVTAGSPAWAAGASDGQGASLAQERGRVNYESNIGLPFAADYMLWLTDTNHLNLMRWNTISSTWEVAMDYPAAQYAWFDAERQVTHLAVPFAALGIGNPANSGLQLVALASDEGAMRLWATMPGGNPLNSPRVANPLLAAQAANRPFTLTRAYSWSSLGSGVCPAENTAAGADVQVQLAASPQSVVYSFLNDSLFYIQNALFGDQSIDTSQIGFLNAAPRPVGVGRPITYTVRYANAGSQVARDVRAVVVAWEPLVLPDGERRTDATLGTFYQQTLTLGDLDPGAQGTAQVRAIVDAASDASLDRASLDLIIYDAAAASRTPLVPLEWVWSDHVIDRGGPTNMQITQARRFVRPEQVLFEGTVSDPAGVQAVTLEQRTATGPAGSNTCLDPNPDDGVWACPAETSGVREGTEIGVRVRCTDQFGQISEWTNWFTMTVDTTPPQVEVLPESLNIVGTGVLGAGEFAVAGVVTDDRQAASAEVCRATVGAADTTTCTTVPVVGTAPTGSWQYVLTTPENVDGIAEQLTITGMDTAGNRSVPVTYTYQLDSIAPGITVTGRLERIALRDYRNPGPNSPPPAVLSGTASDRSGISTVDVLVTLPSGEIVTTIAEYDGSSGWRFVPRAAVLEGAGQYVLRVRGRDVAGNTVLSAPFGLEVTE